MNSEKLPTASRIAAILNLDHEDDCDFITLHILPALASVQVDSAASDVLTQLYMCGPQYDGDICSKSGRNVLLSSKLASKIVMANGEDGWNACTYLGRDVFKVLTHLERARVVEAAKIFGTEIIAQAIASSNTDDELYVIELLEAAVTVLHGHRCAYTLLSELASSKYLLGKTTAYFTAEENEACVILRELGLCLMQEVVRDTRAGITQRGKGVLKILQTCFPQHAPKIPDTPDQNPSSK